MGFSGQFSGHYPITGYINGFCCKTSTPSMTLKSYFWMKWNVGAPKVASVFIFCSSQVFICLIIACILFMHFIFVGFHSVIKNRIQIKYNSSKNNVSRYCLFSSPHVYCSLLPFQIPSIPSGYLDMKLLPPRPPAYPRCHIKSIFF